MELNNDFEPIPKKLRMTSTLWNIADLIWQKETLE